METQALKKIVQYLEDNQLKVVTAESCTAGLIASTLAEIPGCGKWLECAFVTYSEEAKVKCLNVAQKTIDRFGLTSKEVASEMAAGALEAADANFAIANTGIAGPSSGDGEEQVGTVCLAWSFKHPQGIRSFSEKMYFKGDRNTVREAAAAYALERIPHHHEHFSLQDPV